MRCLSELTKNNNFKPAVVDAAVDDVVAAVVVVGATSAKIQLSFNNNIPHVTLNYTQNRIWLIDNKPVDF